VFLPVAAVGPTTALSRDPRLSSVTPETGRAYAWVGVVVDLLLILLGLWMISRDVWTGFAEVLVALCSAGLVLSLVQLWRGRRRGVSEG